MENRVPIDKSDHSQRKAAPGRSGQSIFDPLNSSAQGVLSQYATVSAAQGKQRFGDLVDAAQKSPVVITRNNKPKAVVVSAEAFAAQQIFNLVDVRARIEAGVEDVEAGRTMTTDELSKALGL